MSSAVRLLWLCAALGGASYAAISAGPAAPAAIAPVPVAKDRAYPGEIRLKFQTLAGFDAVLGFPECALHRGGDARQFLTLVKIGGRSQFERKLQQFHLAGNIVRQLEVVEAH